MPFYLLHGPDEFGGAEFLAELKSGLGDPAMIALNTTVLDGRAVSLPELRGACGAMPFLADRRLVIVDGWLTRLLGKADDGDAPPDSPASGATAKETLAELAGYLPELPETTVLVLVEKRTIPERSALVKAAAGQPWAHLKLFDVPKGEGLARWIIERAKTEGGSFSREAARALAGVETDLRALGNEIIKLLIYVNFSRPVEVDDVERLTPAGGEARVFDMVDAIGQRRGPQALRELHRLLEQEDFYRIWGMIVRQFRLMLQAKEMLEARASESDVSKALGLHSFPTGKICAQARNFSLAGLEQIYRRLLDYDADFKTGRVEPASALDALVASLTAA